ncbi:hypothetical protein [Sulfurospirillum arcachonense]|uniref:hypothetical protein n=1 Tax=Sulfurospirillum arcachonense TaxID=57666 RepID=UPI000469A41C|nr:hypothetical protein [Sulfurospirillum arcachonense]
MYMIPKLTAKIMLALCLGLFISSMPLEAAKKPLSPEKQLKKDIKYKKFAEKQINRIPGYFQKTNYKSVERTIEQAKKYIAKISEGYMSSPDGLALQDKLNGYEKQYIQLSTNKAQQSAAANELIDQKARYGQAVRGFDDLLTLLNVGKTKELKNYNASLSKVEFVDKNLPGFLAYENDFRKNFATLIKNHPDYGYQGSMITIKVSFVLDMFKNAKIYRDNLKSLIAGSNIDDFIAKKTDALNLLKSKGYIYYDSLDDLFHNGSNKYFNQDKIGSIPQDKLDKVAAIKKEMVKVIKNTDRKWNSSDYPNDSGDVKKVASRFAKNKGGELIAYGANKSATLYKNGLGIPLYKGYPGMVILHMKDEPFNRGYFTEFKDPYDGTGYPGISVMRKVQGKIIILEK